MTTKTTAVELAADMTIAWLSNPNNRATVTDVPVILTSMYNAIARLSSGPLETGSKPSTSEYPPAVSVRKSLASKDHIVSMIDGKPYKALRRHLTAAGLTADEYRERYNLKANYPMVSQSYSEVRRAMAKKIGLGRNRGSQSDGAKTNVSKPKPGAPQPKG
ncbi:MucR family transcriptional regulator [Sphingomonas sp. PAMC 26617]|uniref:MucR family transcriptional regulator n=1 Tax=Sphingomonas sp. PAMC 26617 TaxID=1112216 RepID=UPI0009DA60BF|nr:MucR family transcriptional regulator [Sphingomonas sp. PAMC 26617]